MVKLTQYYFKIKNSLINFIGVLVTGCVRPGEFLAIMGASGAGKTTLLNCLTFRNTGKLKVSGQRYINGALVNTDKLARISGYVQQDDLFIPTLTVTEHLEFQVRCYCFFSKKQALCNVCFVICRLC